MLFTYRVIALLIAHSAIVVLSPEDRAYILRLKRSAIPELIPRKPHSRAKKRTAHVPEFSESFSDDDINWPVLARPPPRRAFVLFQMDGDKEISGGDTFQTGIAFLRENDEIPIVNF